MTNQADFPVPADLEGFWGWEKGHFPRPVTPLSDDLVLGPMAEGFSAAQDSYACPFGVQVGVFNYYAYLSLFPFDLSDETRPARYERELNNVVLNIGELWSKEWLPSILPAIDRTKALDCAAMSDKELLEQVNQLRQDQLDRWTVHGRLNFSVVAASWFADFYNEEFHPEDATEPYVMLQGFPTKSLEAGKGLWDLSRTVKGSRSLGNVFENTATDQLVAELQKSDDGKAFLTELDRYLDEFGWRTDSLFELSEPTWRELPIVPLNTLQGYLLLDDSNDPEIKVAEGEARREILLSQTRERLAGASEKLSRFNELYEAARFNLPITEDHNYYIDQIGDSILRPTLLELGRRLQANGRISDSEDIFMLYVPEIREAFSGIDQHEVIAEREAEMEHWSRIVPPPTLGTPPPPSDDPWTEAILVKMLGAVPPEPSADPAVIRGTAASPGTVQGKAKVVHNLTEASKVEPGDILVCEMTMPSWTPLFGTVAAIVSDTGGILSHCAVVSREYRIPAVVGTAIGTSVLQDGMMLTVDGSQGIVRIDQRA